MVYTIFASMFAAVVGMCLLGYFAIKPLIRVLQLPEAVTSAFVALFCFVGAYSARNSLTDLWMIVIFGVVGYLFERFRFPVAPMVLGCILGPIAETSFMTSMIAYQNDWTVFFTRPISGTFMAFTILALAYPMLRALRRSLTKVGSDSIFRTRRRPSSRRRPEIGA
jgi:putative tricarboxylic transport membrane protein